MTVMNEFYFWLHVHHVLITFTLHQFNKKKIKFNKQIDFVYLFLFNFVDMIRQ